ncbi:MAG: hypothetical protein AAF502_20385 [Bacteroidota bacterium]
MTSKSITIIFAALLLMFCSSDLLAQQIQSISNGVTAYRPVVKNGRILWFETNGGSHISNFTNKVYVHDGQENKLITEAANCIVTGWPDLDDQGNVAYVKIVNNQHQVFLYDGSNHLQITNNSDIPGSSINMGMANAEFTTAYPRIFNKNIVFKDISGNVYIYERGYQKVRKLNLNDDQTANYYDGNNSIAVPLGAHLKYFEYQGNYITWIHEKRIDETKSEITVFQADELLDWKVKKVHTFTAWCPGGEASVVGRIFDPFFMACGEEIAWQYYPASGVLRDNFSYDNIPDDNFNQYRTDGHKSVIIQHFDGNNVTTITENVFVKPQSMRIQGGAIVWAQIDKVKNGKKTIDYERVFRSNGSTPFQVASYTEHPPKGQAGSTRWNNIIDVKIWGGEVFWVMDQVKCTHMFQDYCSWIATEKVGIFKATSGSNSPIITLDNHTFGGGGELDNGLYAFMTGGLTAIRDIKAIQLMDDDARTQAIVQLVDHKSPKVKQLKKDKPFKAISDVFSLYSKTISSFCGTGETGTPVDILSMTFEVEANGVKAELSDIKKINLYHDTNKNQKIDPGKDKLIGSTEDISSSLKFEFEGKNALSLPAKDFKFFIVEMELKEVTEVCPCNEYGVSLYASAIELDSGDSAPQLTGSTTGILKFPKAKIEEYWGDEQASLPNTELKEKLGVFIKDFPEKCGMAHFKIVNKFQGDNAQIIDPEGQKDEEFIFDFDRIDNDVKAEVGMILGEREGLYNVEFTVASEDQFLCEKPRYIFREHAGTLTLQLLDINDPSFYEATADNSHPDYSSWQVKVKDDIASLSDGGEGRAAALTDGCSSLLVRVRLQGFHEVPPGEVEISISGGSPMGFLTQAAGTTLPPENGAETLSTPWVETDGGIMAFALYTPPLNFEDENATDRNITFTASYQLPEAPEPISDEKFVGLFRPPILFVHGMWSSPDTWGPNYMSEDPRYRKYLADYAELSAHDFSENGLVIKERIGGILEELRGNGMAATKVSVVSHSMGGLITRQYIADGNGSSYRRQDNFGQGDIYKFITMGTPHFGSPVAWLVKSLRDHNTIGAVFQDVADYFGTDITSGAVDAMCPGSQQLYNLGITHVPSHTIRAWYFDAHAEDITWETVASLFEELFGYTEDQLASPNGMNPKFSYGLLITALQFLGQLTVETGIQELYSSDKHDLLVTKYQQAGGIAQGANFVFDNTLHSKPGINTAPVIETETNSPEIAAHVFWLIEQNVDNISLFNSYLPRPRVQDDLMNCGHY